MPIAAKAFAVALVCCLALTAANADQGATLTFGVVPQQAASKLARTWTPLLLQIGAESGYRIRFKTAPDIPTFERRVLAGEYDFAYMNPYHFTVFNQVPGYRAIAKARDKRIRGIIVVAADSRIESLAGLAGATLAFPSPAAFAASVLPRATLAQQGIAFTPNYVSSHDSVYRSVAKGLYPAGGGVVRTLDAIDASIRDQLRVLWKSEGYTPHAIAAHPRVPRDVAGRVQSALRNLDSTSAGANLLEPLSLKGFEAATSEDWDDVRALEIRMLNPLLEQ